MVDCKTGSPNTPRHWRQAPCQGHCSPTESPRDTQATSLATTHSTRRRTDGLWGTNGTNSQHQQAPLSVPRGDCQSDDQRSCTETGSTVGAQQPGGTHAQLSAASRRGQREKKTATPLWEAPQSSPKPTIHQPPKLHLPPRGSSRRSSVAWTGTAPEATSHYNSGWHPVGERLPTLVSGINYWGPDAMEFS